MVSTLKNRMMLGCDAPVAAQWLGGQCPLEPDFAIELAQLLQRFLALECIKGVMIEALNVGTGAWHPVAIGMSAFVDPAHVSAYLAEPKPFLFVELLRHAAKHDSQILLTPDSLARANQDQGSDLVAVYMQSSWDFSSAFWRAVGEISHGAFVRHHRGCRLNRALHEDWQRDMDIYIASGFSVHTAFDVPQATFDNFGQLHSKQRILYYADSDQCLARAPGSTVSFIFNYVPPVCGLTRAEQRVMTHAIEGETDDEIARNLGVSTNTIKQVWRSVYGRIGDRFQHVFHNVDDAGFSGDSRRGPEKRRHAVAFLKNHPQELRPH